MKKLTLLFSLLLVFTVGCDLRPDFHQEPLQNKNPQQGAPSKSAPQADSLIEPKEARAIALEYADIDSDNVKFIKTDLDRDDGIAQYEVEFIHDHMEYDITIDALDGTVLSFEKDFRD